jgi:Ca2+-binding EF-hand superfamily protein
MAIPINEDPYRNSRWSTIDEFDQIPIVPYRPQSLGCICKLTKFSRREIQLIYRSFKQRCPTGIITCPTFLDVYSQLFPHGHPANYARYVFRTFDKDDDHQISFEEFVTGLSIITRGSVEEKLDWIFELYDLNKVGSIGQQELFAVTRSVYELHGRNPDDANTKRDIRNRVLWLHNKLCSNGEVRISQARFIDACRNDKDLCESIQHLNTIL